MSLLDVKGLNKAIKKREILKNISFSMEEGELLGFAGANGAGKTTTMRCCLGLSRYESGEVLFNGINIKSNMKEYISNTGVIFDQPGFYPELSAYENIFIRARLNHMQIDASLKKRIADLLEQVGLRERANDKVKTFSYGMKQRLNIACALLHSPLLLFLDEPFNGVDPEGIVEIRNMLIRLNKENGMSALISSHQLSELEKLCTRTICIKEGEIVGEITPQASKKPEKADEFEEQYLTFMSDK